MASRAPGSIYTKIAQFSIKKICIKFDQFFGQATINGVLLQIDEELLVPLVEKSMKICISDGRFGGHSDVRGCADDAERLQTPLEFKILV